ncbi:MAG: P-type conjugative transfer ATPase TrbB [Gammaproteobacteria bacterium RIFCSPHIGHO2_12_FULL_45_9]|nr:MAG: P-type conjugative transfer ATPase TrbB [Gammaproteobacteria bacterium RIFCSPHIGHO2_12_FULL_45_9]
MTQTTHQRLDTLLVIALGDQLCTLLKDPDLVELMLNPDGKVFVERLSSGKTDTGSRITSQSAENIIKLVAASKGLEVTADTPEVAAEMKSFQVRFQGWLPPVVTAATFTMRKKAQRIFSLQDYVTAGTLTPETCAVLQDAIRSKKNILVAGGTSSGKTTFTNALLAELNHTNERILLLEDLPELQVDAPDIVRLQTTPTISLRHLLRGALRMRPDRIIIGEVRDGAALDLLKAWNTGHPGGLCTIHANSAEQTIARLIQLIEEVSTTVPHHLIQEAVQVIVYLERDETGRRSVKTVQETI